MKCILRVEARTELEDATFYYEGQRDDLGDEFLEDFLLGIAEIEEGFVRWPEVLPGVRRFRLSRFPYSIVYRVLSDRVEVIAIAHQARRESYWEERLV